MYTKRNKMNIEEFVEAEHEVYLDLINRIVALGRFQTIMSYWSTSQR